MVIEVGHATVNIRPQYCEYSTAIEGNKGPKCMVNIRTGYFLYTPAIEAKGPKYMTLVL